MLLLKFLGFLLCCFSHPGLTQDQKTADSLKSTLGAFALNDSLKMDILRNLAFHENDVPGEWCRNDA